MGLSTLQSVEVERLRAELAEARQQNHVLSESNKRLYAENLRLQAQVAVKKGGSSIVGMKTVKDLAGPRGGAKIGVVTGTARRAIATRSRDVKVEVKEVATADQAEEETESDLSGVSLLIPTEKEERENKGNVAARRCSAIPIIKVTPADTKRSPLSDSTNRSPKAASPSPSKVRVARTKRRSSASPQKAPGASDTVRSATVARQVRAEFSPRLELD